MFKVSYDTNQNISFIFAKIILVNAQHTPNPTRHC